MNHGSRTLVRNTSKMANLITNVIWSFNRTGLFFKKNPYDNKEKSTKKNSLYRKEVAYRGLQPTKAWVCLVLTDTYFKGFFFMKSKLWKVFFAE